MTSTPLWFKLSMATLTAVGLLVAVAMMPLVANQRADKASRAERGALAARYAAAGADARAVSDLAMAGRAYAAAIELEPGDEALRTALAEVHIEQILADNTVLDDTTVQPLQLELSAHMLAGRRDARTLTAYGKVLLYRGFAEAARERLREAVALDAELLPAHVFLADALLRAEEWTGAQSSAERALSIAPDDGLAHFAMGRAKAGLEDWDAAAVHFRKASESLDVFGVWRALADVEVRREKWAEAETAYRQALAKRPEAADIYAGYAKALAFTGKLGPAARYFQMAWERTADADAYASLGDVALKAHDYEQAARVFADMVRLRQGDPEILCRLGYAEEGRGDKAQARRAFARCAQAATAVTGKERLVQAAKARLEVLGPPEGAQVPGAPEARGKPGK